MPKETNNRPALEVAGPGYDLFRDPAVPFPGVPGAAIPCRFTASVRDRENQCTAHFEVVVEDGRPRIHGLALVSDGNPRTPTELRRLPIGSYLDAVVRAALMKPPTSTFGTVTTTVVKVMDAEEGFRAVEAGKASRRRRRPVTRETLERVRDAYNDAPKRKKTAYVADAMDCAEGYARQLVKKARDEKLLPPSGRRKNDG